MFQHHYQRFLKINEGKLHFACHSHHYWPDVTREATLQYWDDSAQYTDDKWVYFFSNILPKAQKSICSILNIPQEDSGQIVFAPNTHEFVFRLFSCLDRKRMNRILTTDSEFHSFDRQLHRSLEEKYFQCDIISTQPFDHFEERMIEKLNEHDYDLIFFSHVFFNSGMAVKNLERILSHVKNPNCLIVLDAYHSFMAMPLDFSRLKNNVFYLAGNYKYAQGGEGACFLYVPKRFLLRPEYTGWFSELEKIEGHNSEVFYPQSAMAMAGSTMDFSAIYRFNAVMDLFAREGITVEKIHAYIQSLQAYFLSELKKIDHHYLSEKNILYTDLNYHGHFLTFQLPNNDVTKHMCAQLKSLGIFTDFRGARLRFGFGLYQTPTFLLDGIKNL